MKQRNILALIPLVPAVMIILLEFMSSPMVFEPPYLLAILNTAFLAIVPLVIAFMAARVFNATGKLSILFIGAAMMSLGVGGLISGWLLMGLGGPNATITVYNSGALLSAFFHFAAGLVSINFYKGKIEDGRGISLAVAYAAPAVLLVLISSAAAQELTPSFIIQGAGPTDIGRTVLVAGIVLMAATYAISLWHYMQSELPLFLWYSTGLGLFTVGLTGVFLQHAVGSLIGWAGRLSQYLGAVFLLSGVVDFAGSLHRKGETAADAIARFFEDAEDNYKALVQTARDGIISLDDEGRVLLWNQGAEKMFGYGRNEAKGKHLSDLILPDCCDPEFLSALSCRGTGASYKGQSESNPLSFEAVVKTMEGVRFPVEFSFSRRETTDGTVSTCIVRDITERKLADNALLKTKHLLAEGQKIAHVGSFEYIADTGRTVWSDEEFRIFGLEPEGASPDYEKMLANSIYPDDAELLHRTFTAALQRGSVYELEYRIKRPDGSVRWAYDLAYPYFNDTGKLDRYIGTTLDITERKMHEEDILKLNADLERKMAERTAELRISEEKYRLLVENNSDCIWEMDANGRFTYLSPTFQHITGYTPEEFLGKSPLDFVPKHPAAISDESASLIFSAHKPVPSLEYDLVSREGHHVVIELNAVPIFGSDGSFKGYRGITRDITERRRLEEQLQRRERDLREILDNIPSLVGYLDKDLRCRFGNHVYQDWFGIDPAEMTGMHFKDVIGEEGFRISMPRIEAALSGQQQVFERIILPVTNRSNEKYCLIHYIPDLADGQVHGFYVMAYDITPLKLAEEQRKQIAKAESLGRMAGAISHLFNNQLQVVIGNLELLMNRMALGSESHVMAIDALTASHKAADISKMMLTYLGQSPGRQEIQDLSETCRKGLLMARAAIPKNISVKTEIPFPGPAVNANTSQLFQIIINLLTNAWESITDENGAVTLSVRTVSSADISVSNRFPVGWQPKEGSYAVIEVLDTGCGIPKENLGKIFDPFFTTKFTGRGLGLSTVLGIIGTLGGAITVENRTGGGVAFRVYLPLAPKTAPVVIEKKAAEVKVPSGGVVLLVDDQDQVRNMAGMMLSRLGFSVLEAADGVQAVDTFMEQKDNITCVITDLTMPRMNGWETLAALRKISPHIPVILSSGYDESQVMAQNRQNELPDAFLGKPYHYTDLQETIHRVLASKTAE